VQQAVSVVLRHPDQAVALTIAKLSIEAALNDKIGYDQYQRETYWQALQKANYDPAKITVACEEDCTAGVSANVRAAGYLCGVKALQSVPLCSSRNMREKFTAAGFQALTAARFLNGDEYLLPGDVLLYEDHHAAANVTCGKAVIGDWHPDDIQASVEPVRSPCVVASGSVFIRKGPDTSYESMGVLSVGQRLRWFGYAAPNGWLLVEYRRATGWVSDRYARVEDAS
ncbi:MAG: SH3 domain-containing protein, partial [bacterium]